MMAGLQKTYREKVVPDLMKQFGFKSVMQVPKLEKVVLNVGVGDAATDPKALESAIEEMTLIAGQKPVKTIARKSIAGFKIREGMALGCCVTLRGERMYEFLERLICIALPRVRDFKGISGKSFDERGNYNFSIKEQIIFPEIDVDKVDTYHGMNVTVVTTAKNVEEGKALLAGLGMPFRKN
ncbi:MAG: 50S ribosomal protein L5 [Spirochaetia bacterium]|nr:50S ribosomal protein L5 [Spirochaetia bacterium]